MTPREAVELLTRLHGGLGGARWGYKDVTGFIKGHYYSVCDENGDVVFEASTRCQDDSPDIAPCGDEAEVICKLRNALPALRKVIEDQQREIERLRSKLPHREDCPDCKGTGIHLISNPRLLAAVRCECTEPLGLELPE